MKRTISGKWLTALVIVGVLGLTACTTGNNEVYYQMSDAKTVQASFNGEWTVNRQVVDTARLEVGPTLRVRLPEAYLLNLCTTAQSGVLSQMEPTGLPVEIATTSQGYTAEANFSSFGTVTEHYGSVVYYKPVSFTAVADGALHRIDILSTEKGNAVRTTDSGAWTIGISIGGLAVTNLYTQEQSIRQLPAPITLYYNTTERIR